MTSCITLISLLLTDKISPLLQSHGWSNGRASKKKFPHYHGGQPRVPKHPPPPHFAVLLPSCLCTPTARSPAPSTPCNAPIDRPSTARAAAPNGAALHDMPRRPRQANGAVCPLLCFCLFHNAGTAMGSCGEHTNSVPCPPMAAVAALHRTNAAHAPSRCRRGRCCRCSNNTKRQDSRDARRARNKGAQSKEDKRAEAQKGRQDRQDRQVRQVGQVGRRRRPSSQAGTADNI